MNSPIEIFKPGVAKVGATGEYAIAFTTVSGGNLWNTTSTTFVDPPITGGAASLTFGGTIPLALGGSTGTGVTFTPSSQHSVYLVIATSTLQSQTADDWADVQLTDGAVVLSQSAAYSAASPLITPFTLIGVYAPGTVLPVTLKLQLAVSSGNLAYLGNTNAATVPRLINWTIVRIA